jgi:hypothetical protein
MKSANHEDTKSAKKEKTLGKIEKSLITARNSCSSPLLRAIFVLFVSSWFKDLKGVGMC